MHFSTGLHAVLFIIGLALGVVAVFGARAARGRQRTLFGVLSLLGFLLAFGEVIDLIVK